METLPIQNAIKLITFQVLKVDFKLDPSCLQAKENLEMPQYLKNININLGFAIGYNDQKPHNYSVNFDLKITESTNYLYLDIKCIAVFETKDPITDEFKESGFIKTNSPAIAFPFLRSFANTLTSNAGINPIILPAFNFSPK
ncbi:MAG: protein-export chaperone SecB [Bacteroidales bacterium]